MSRKRTPASFVFLLGALALYAGPVPAQGTRVDAPFPAPPLVTSAVRSAKTSHKRVFVLFHASWCGWCKRLEAMMSQPENRKIIEANYEIVRLDVEEHTPEKRSQFENPGGASLLKAWGGEKSGLPFYVLLDEKGKKLADSNVMPKQANIGYPGEPDEIVAFGEMLKRATPRLTEADRAQLLDYLRKNAPAPQTAPAPR